MAKMTPMAAMKAKGMTMPNFKNIVPNAKGLLSMAVNPGREYKANKKADLFLSAKNDRNAPEFNADGEVTSAYKIRVVAGAEMRKMRKKQGMKEESSNPKSITKVY